MEIKPSRVRKRSCGALGFIPAALPEGSRNGDTAETCPSWILLCPSQSWDKPCTQRVNREKGPGDIFLQKLKFLRGTTWSFNELWFSVMMVISLDPLLLLGLKNPLY